MHTTILRGILLFSISSLLFSSCVEECTFRDWEGSYFGTVICDDFIDDNVILDAFLDIDGATVIYVGDYFSTSFYDDGCDVEFFQRSSVGRDDFQEEYYIELRGNEILWTYESNENGRRTNCEGTFLRF